MTHVNLLLPNRIKVLLSCVVWAMASKLKGIVKIKMKRKQELGQENSQFEFESRKSCSLWQRFV